MRTILQHAWAEIEHDIQYKSTRAIPTEIRRRFLALAGMLEIADKEFQDIQNANREIEDKAVRSVKKAELTGVEITPIALKAYLDKKLGPDGRISDWSYDWTVRLLKRLGFRDLQQVDKATAPYNADRLSDIGSGRRQGQTTRFEFMLMAALGDKFLERQFDGGYISSYYQIILNRFREAGIVVGTFDLRADRPDQITVSGA